MENKKVSNNEAIEKLKWMADNLPQSTCNDLSEAIDVGINAIESIDNIKQDLKNALLSVKAVTSSSDSYHNRMVHNYNNGIRTAYKIVCKNTNDENNELSSNNSNIMDSKDILDLLDAAGALNINVDINESDAGPITRKILEEGKDNA